MKKNYTDVMELLQQRYGEGLSMRIDEKSAALVCAVPLAQLLEIIALLKTRECGLFNSLIDIWGVDYPAESKRFAVYYSLLSVEYNLRVMLSVRVDPETPVPSMVSLFPAASWFEREVWDMYGIVFDAHPDLRRILTDYGFEGYPLRKDFPLTGYKEVRYDAEEQRVIYEPVVLTQDYRQFDFLSPWEGTTYQLPGDEKAEGAPAANAAPKTGAV